MVNRLSIKLDIIFKKKEHHKRLIKVDRSRNEKKHSEQRTFFHSQNVKAL